MVLDGELGEGGELPCEDLGEARAESEKELSRRYLGILTPGPEASLTPVLTNSLSDSGGVGLGVSLDRKSTRLNSSHWE